MIGLARISVSTFKTAVILYVVEEIAIIYYNTSEEDFKCDLLSKYA
jgi:hypothetical protein